MSTFALSLSGQIVEAGGSGDVSGPGSSTDKALAIWNGTGGDTLSNTDILYDGTALKPASHGNRDLGTDALEWRTLYLDTSIEIADLLSISDGSDRINLDAPVYQFKTATHNRLYIADNHPQVTLQNADLWLEPGDGGSTQGSIAAFNADVSDIGYSTIQQGDLPGFRPFRHIALSNTLWFVPASERTSVTIASTTVPDAVFSGTIAGNNALLTWNNWYGQVYHTGSQYWEMYLGLSGLNLVQTNQNFNLNYESGHGKFIIGDSNAASDGDRLETVTLSSGSATVSNTSVTAKTCFFHEVRTATNQGFLSFAPNAGVGYTVTSSSGTDSSVIKVFLVENGR